MPASPTATPEHIRDVNERYHDCAADSYDAKWGIDFGDIGRDQTRQKLVKALGELPEQPFDDALEIGSGTGYFSLNLMQEGVIAEPRRNRRLDRDAHEPLRDRRVAGPRGSGRDPPGRRRGASLRGRELRPRPRTRRPSPHPRSREGLLRVRPRPSARRSDRLLRRAVRLRRPPGCRSQAHRRRWRSCVADADARAARRKATAPTSTRTTATGSRARSTSTPSTPARSATGWTQTGFEDIRVQGEELLANMYGWILRSLESSAEARGRPGPLAVVRIPQLHRAAAGRREAARAAPPRAALLQPRSQRPQARLAPLAEGEGVAGDSRREAERERVLRPPRRARPGDRAARSRSRRRRP